jgi:hypothetical protein
MDFQVIHIIFLMRSKFMSNSNLTRKAVKKALMGAAILATTPVLAKGAGAGQGDAAGGKSQLGVNHLSLDQEPGRNATICASPESVSSKTGSNLTPNDLNIAVDPFENAYIDVIFHVRDLLAHGQDHLLFLAYSSQTTPEGSPNIPTPKSKNELRLNMSQAEILAVFQVPAQTMLTQAPTRLGMANPAPHSTVTFKVNLDTSVLPRFMDNDEKAYLQAGLIPAAEYDELLNNNKADNMILSELDTIGFVKTKCPDNNASMGIDVADKDSGEKQDGMIKVVGFHSEKEPEKPPVTKTRATASASAEVSITK